MKIRSASTGRARISGVRKIVRHSYNTISGLEVKGGWWDLVALVKKRSGGRCEDRSSGNRCSCAAVEVHHIVPLSAGGTNRVSNLIHLCKTHHDKRHRHLYKARTLGASTAKPRQPAKPRAAAKARSK